MQTVKPNILYYSDCSFFAGCENMIANFLNDPELKENFTISFAYNFSEKYELGLNSRVSNSNYKKYPLKLIKQININKPIKPNYFRALTNKLFYSLYIPIYKYFSIFGNIILLYNFFRKQNVDILHINNGGYPAAFSCYSAVFAARLSGITRIIYVVNNLAEDYRHPFRWIDYALDFFTKRWVTVFVTGSIFAGNRLKHVLSLDDKKHITINNGIKKRPILNSREHFRISNNIPEKKIIGTVVANLEKRKGHIYLLEAIAKLKNEKTKNLNLLFIIEGTGPEESNIENYIRENTLEDWILRFDNIPNIFDLINASDFLIIPSISHEDFPNITLEAMSLEKPVIGTNIAGIPEQIDNNINGFVVKSKNSDELKNAILKLSLDEVLLSQFSIEAKKKFDNVYEHSLSIRKYLELYNNILKS